MNGKAVRAGEAEARDGVLHSVGTAFEVIDGEAGAELRCASCHHVYGPTGRDPKLAAVCAERSIVESCDLNRYGATDDLVLREFFCPSCGAMIAVNVQRPGDPVMREIELD